jgi:hypothetical protein
MSAKGLCSLGKVTLSPPAVSADQRCQQHRQLETGARQSRVYLCGRKQVGGFHGLSGLLVSVNTHSRAKRKLDGHYPLSCVIRSAAPSSAAENSTDNA